MIEGIEYLITKNNSVANETHAKISLDKEDPTQAEIDAEVIRLQAEYDAQEYARKRASAYASVGDQLDMMMKDKRDGTTTHQTACEAVKTQFPKG